VILTLLLVVSVLFIFGRNWAPVDNPLLRQSESALIYLSLLLGAYTAYKQLEIERIQRYSNDRDEVFRIIGENAADMIAVVDIHGNRLYNSPSYRSALGYSPEELERSGAFDQIHPEDRDKVMRAAQRAQHDGVGTRLEYRVRHKDGKWKVFESTASAVLDGSGKTTKLVVVNRDITERKELEQKLKHQALHDDLTGLLNRTSFMNRLQRAFERASRDSKYVFAVLFIDLDEFKAFNDTLGHAAGDLVLIEVARRIGGCLRFDDLVSRPTSEQHDDSENDTALARFGGDEFTVLVGSIKQSADAIRVAKRIQESLSLPLPVNGQEVFPSVSVGIALSTMPGASAGGLLRDADTAMYRAKAHGKAGCEIFDAEMHASAISRLKLETDLHRAYEHREFILHYQPIVLLGTGRVVGFESLIRWNNPATGLVPPDQFIAAAERTGLIIPIGNWVLRESCRRLQILQNEFGSSHPLTMSVNVSAKQFTASDLVGEVYSALRETGIRPDTLQLEITESISMGGHGDISRILSSLKAVGVRVAIDDFGTGYSSLSRLHHLQADVLKIDRSFVSRMTDDKDDREIVRHIITLARSLRLRVIAEGVETHEQANLLNSLGCEFGQGYLFSKPIEAEHTGDIFKTCLAEHGSVRRRHAETL